MTAKQLEATFAAKAVAQSSNLLILAPDDAIDLVREAARAGIPILGVDGILVGPDATTSPIEHIADYSAASGSGNGCWADAEAFIESRRGLGLCFEVLLDAARRV